jgi:hypothetical protein
MNEMESNKLDINTLIALYKKKHDMLAEGDLSALIALKKSLPELFVKENEDQLNDLVSTVNFLMETPHFQEMIKQDKKNKLVTLDYHNWTCDSIKNELEKILLVSIKNVFFISRAFVQSFLIKCLSICRDELNNTTIHMDIVFPFLALLVSKIITLFPQPRQQKMIESALFKLKIDHAMSIDSDKVSAWKTSVSYCHIEKTINPIIQDMIDMTTMKFDQRKSFYQDALFFFLINVSEYIGLLLPNIDSNTAGVASMLIIELLDVSRQ